MTDQLNAMLRRHEGIRTILYSDTRGIPTIGVGHNLRMPISQQAVNQILQDDVQAIQEQIGGALPWVGSLDAVRYDALTDMAFNLGIGGLLEFKQFLGHLQAGEWDQAKSAMLDSRWASQVGNRAQELAQMIVSGAYQEG